MSNINSTYILGVKVNMGISVEDAVAVIDAELIRQNKDNTEIHPNLISTTNPEFIMDAQRDVDFKNIINNSFLSVPDGVGVILSDYYSKLLTALRKKYPYLPVAVPALYAGLKTMVVGFTGDFARSKRVTGVALTLALLELANTKGYTIFLLGGKLRDNSGKFVNNSADLAKHTSEIVHKMYPNIHIVGASSAFSREQRDDDATKTYIKDCMRKKNINHIDMLFVAYNHVWQEKWISRNAKDIPSYVNVGVGATYDYISGVMRPAPESYTNRNLDWLFRLFIQPWRFKRIFKAFPLFPFTVFIQSLSK